MSPFSPEHRARLRELFEGAVAHLGEARRHWIDAQHLEPSLREELLALLTGDESADTSRGPFGRSLQTRAEDIGIPARELASRLIGTRIGTFRVGRLLGEGGTATVFLGEREGGDFDQTVALKLLRRGLYSEFEQRLFRREQQLLAQLQHPNIARLIDGGVAANGIPYLVIEYVDGESIVQTARTRKLDLPSRLRLFVVVCRAVAAAHRSLIVHRDLKPGNILVDRDGVVKLLDFGIAKLLGDDSEHSTRTGEAAYTPGYAAPEQMRNEPVSTATDVYALGVVMHELLLGRRPPAGSGESRMPSSRVAELAEAGDTLPIPQATLRSALRGDLDNILLMAMDDEPDRRYANAADLADDVERFLAAQPVHAHPPSRRYRARKFVQRHRGGVAITVTFALGLLASFAAVVWQANVARAQSVRATAEAQRANLVRDFVVGVFESARASLPRDQRPTPERLVAEAQARLQRERGLDAATMIDLQRTLGEVWLSVANYAAAERAFATALRAAQTSGRPQAVIDLRVLHADALQRRGRNAQAARSLGPLIPALRRERDASAKRALEVLARVRESEGDIRNSLRLRLEVAQLARSLEGSTSAASIAALMNAGSALSNAEFHVEAIAVLEPALASWRALYPEDDARHVEGFGSLLASLAARGETEGLEARILELLALKRRIYPTEHDTIATSLASLAVVAHYNDDLATAESRYREALAMRRRLFGDRHVSVADSLDQLGAFYGTSNRAEESLRWYGEALAICEALQIRDLVCSRSRNNRGQTLYRLGRMEEAREDMEAALRVRRALLGDHHPTVAYSLSTLSNTWLKENPSMAVSYATRAMALLDRHGYGASGEAALARHTLASALWRVKRNEEALREIDRAAADYLRVAPDGQVRWVMMQVLRAQILRDLQRMDESRGAASAAIDLGVEPELLPPRTRMLLRQLSGRQDLYPDIPDTH